MSNYKSKGFQGFMNSRKRFNKVIADAAGEFVNTKDEHENNHSKYKTEKQYQASFKEILDFGKKFKLKQKNDIDSVIYHMNNNDGISASYLIWKFLTKDGKHINKNILFIGVNPDDRSSGISHTIHRIMGRHIEGRNVMMVDLNFNKETFDEIQKKSKSLIVIDNHKTTVDMADNIFSSVHHAACVSTFKFFYPNEEVPIWLIYVDDSDMKLYLKFIKHSQMFSVFMNVRLSQNNMLEKAKAFNSINKGGYEVMRDVLSHDNLSWMAIAGSYMYEIQENYKFLLARNGWNTLFYGYNVVILNLEFTGVENSVARQMIVNQNNKYKYQNSQKKVDFAVLWSYHQGSKEYKVKLVADHQSKKHNMIEIAKK